MAATAEAVLEIIANEAGIDRAGLRPDASFAQLDIGSLDFASALFMLEDRFDITIDPEQLSLESTVQDLVDLVSGQLDG